LFVPPGGEYELVAEPGMRLPTAPAGQTSVFLRAPSMARDVGVRSVFVGDDGLEDVAIVVRREVALEGEFVWESTPPPAFDWRSVRVGLDFRRYHDASSFRISTVDGRFRMERVEALEQQLRVDGLPDGVYVESARIGSTDVLVGGFNPADHSGRRMRIVLGNQPARIGGAVVSGRDAVGGAVVTLVPDGARRGRTDLIRTAVTDAEGRFLFEGVAPGTYMIFGWTAISDGAIENEAFRLPYEARATRVVADRRGVADVVVDVIP
jgi:hypothetical protein